ncbi:hypothetical protein K504DRAFT_448719 [Pleomassaria siparia CBS 279.74]|uniref:FAD/NAD(P)-binding domain-containing protein n=1 Tax=Pleomassaria siparia CBS 279.74 TaxID=1314801 RepID=A0A6G1JZA8_9PLEO|nr:hypothetical protein K504DRAFT_448719 [Pleomassaria siparia CBS 279.74]
MGASLEELLRITGVQYIQGTVKSILVDNDEAIFRNPQIRYGARTYQDSRNIDINEIKDATKLDTHLKNLVSLAPPEAPNTVVVIVVVCGGSFTGIELVVELPQRLRGLLGERSNICVVIAERRDEIEPYVGPNLRLIILQSPKKLGVEMQLGAAMTAIKVSNEDNKQRLELAAAALKRRKPSPMLAACSPAETTSGSGAEFVHNNSDRFDGGTVG